MFNAIDIIARKRDGRELSSEQIEWLIDAYTSGAVADYQMAALAMAIYLRGMSDAETAALTEAMRLSGRTLAWPDDSRPVVDKHSTGGVGDKVSLPLAPLLACCGVRVPMISGRGLGPTGGTLDKLESIPGYRTDLTEEEIYQVVDQIGCVITGATASIAPADKKLYALRDVTATVASIPLITASIMSKKLSEGLGALVLDVKFGSGAFMKSYEDAATLARNMIAVGRRMNVATSALLSDMSQPLGRMIGHSVEVDESVDVLRGQGPADVVELTLALGGELLCQANIATSPQQGAAMLQQKIDSGEGLQKFRQMVAAQGGDLDAPRDRAPVSEVKAAAPGTVRSVNTEELGRCVIALGGGRKVVTDQIDASVGLEWLVRVGERVEKGQPLLHVFAPPDKAALVAPRLLSAIEIGEPLATSQPLWTELSEL